MNIYTFDHTEGVKDWVLAPTMKEAKEFYIKFTACGNIEGCKVKALPKKDWGNNYILDINESEPDPDEVGYNEDDYCCGYKIQETFAEYAARETTTDMIATTEY